MIRISDIRIRPKLTFFFIMTGLVPLAIVGGIGTYLAAQSLLQKSIEQLRIVQGMRKSQVENAFEERLKDLKVLAANQHLQGLTNDLSAYRRLYGSQATAPFALETEQFRAISRKYRPFCRDFVEAYGYYDLSIIAADTGHLMFSTAQESDLGASLSTDRYRNQGKAQVWRAVLKTGKAAMADFARHEPSKGQESAFIGHPVYSADNTLTGVVVLQFSPSFINEIMDSRKGMGKSGESYLIGWLADKDLFEFRSDMQTMGAGSYTVGSVLDKAPPYWRDALSAGKDGGSGNYLDSTGVEVLVTFDKVSLPGMEWFLISKIDRQEVLAPLWSIIRNGLAAALVLACGIALCSWFYSKEFVRPLAEDVQFAQAIAQGQLDRTLSLTQQDEFGELAQALNHMAGRLQEIDWLKRGKEALYDVTRGEHDVEELARRFIASFTKHLEGRIGALYLNTEGMLHLAAGYAFTDRSGEFNHFRIGEGVIGQAARNNEIIYFSRAEEAPHLNYGVAEEIPGSFMVAPLSFEESLVGVILVGSEQVFGPLERHFITENLENSAILFNMARSHQTISELLDHTREQQEVLEMKNFSLAAQTQILKESEAELQVQQEELRVTNEELGEQTRILKESEASLQAQQEELRVTNEELQERTEALAKQKLALRNKTLELIRTQKDVEKKAKDLEMSSKYKSEFLANMSHELRTPLNSILILSQLFGKNKDGNLTEKQIESARAIYTSGSELLNLINEILDLSKVEAGKVELVIEQTSIAATIDNLKRVFQDIAIEKDVPFEISVAEDVPATLQTDPQRFQQILRNLLSNAFKFTQKGKVSLTVSRPPAALLTEGHWQGNETLAFAVQDEGIGIPVARQHEIFEAFQQVDGSTSRTYGGTGLGLSISKELTRLLGGRIFLESSEGVGSTFTIVLPERGPVAGLQAEYGQVAEGGTAEHAAQGHKPPISDRLDPAPPGMTTGSAAPAPIIPSLEPPTGSVHDDRKNIGPEDQSLLIIEDDRKFAEILRDFARERGFKCIVAENGETGLYLADYYRPNAIILDIGLPGISGWVVMERLKENPALRHIPVHFMSASDSSRDAMRMGAIGFLTKPVSLDKIEEAFGRIETLLSKSVRRLLVVEDDSIQRESIRQLIGGSDIETTTVATGQEAFAELSRGGYDCMILDLGLSDMSGFELLEKIRSDRSCTAVPVIVYTGRDLSLEEEEELREYTESIIIKGVKSPERLLDESALFLHRVEAEMPAEKQRMLKLVHDKEAVLEGKTVLLVDDDMRNVFALSSVLEEKGLNIIVARNGLESLQKLGEIKEISLVLMDIMMPLMDGYEAMREIRKDARLKKLPIIALTAKAMMGDRNKCIEAGANDYLAKPVDIEKLLSMLRVWLYS